MPNASVMVRCNSCGTLNRVPAERLGASPRCGQCKSPLAYPSAPVVGATANYDQILSAWPEALLAEFQARWCGYCRVIGPVVADLAHRRAGALKVVTIDVDAEPALARRFDVRATPTFILYRNGRQLARLDGAPADQRDLEAWIDRTLRQVP